MMTILNMKEIEISTIEVCYLRSHVVCDTELQVLDNALHGVVGLLPCGAQVLLHGPRHGSEDGLGGLPGVHHFPRVFGGGRCVFVLVTLDVGEGLFHCHHQPGRSVRDS